jgi:hypothetical protein
MALESRISRLEERHALEPELASGLTISDAYKAIMDRPDLIAVEDSDSPGTCRLRKAPPRTPAAHGKKLTPEEAYAMMRGDT